MLSLLLLIKIQVALNNYFEIKLAGISPKFLMGPYGRHLSYRGSYKKAFGEAFEERARASFV